MKKVCGCVLALFLMTGGCMAGSDKKFTLTSTAFKHNTDIPMEYTCEGKDVAPDLAWANVPEGTQSLVLINDDPDAPGPNEPNRFTWDHWLLFNIPPTTQGIPKGGQTPAGARNGTNSWKRTGYGGPCPPIGKHRYIFTLYALDTMLNLDEGASKSDIKAAMKAHIVGTAELIGLYQKQKK